MVRRALRCATRFVALAIAAGMMGPARGAELPGAEEVGAAVERVLTRAEFQPPRKGMIQRAWEWLSEKVQDLQEWIVSNLADGLQSPGVTEVVLIVLLVPLIVLLLHLVWTILGYREPGKPPAGRAAVPEGAAVLSPQPHLEAAAALAAEGRFLEASHALYRGVVLWMDVAGRVRFHEFKTGGDYARELSGTPLSPHFRALLAVFYPLAYGGRPARSDSYRRLRETATRLGVPG